MKLHRNSDIHMAVSRIAVYLTTVTGNFLQACLLYDAWTGNEHVTCDASLLAERKPLPAPYVDMVSMHLPVKCSTHDQRCGLQLMEKSVTARWLHCLQKVKVKANLSMPIMASTGTRQRWEVTCIPQMLYTQNDPWYTSNSRLDGPQS